MSPLLIAAFVSLVFAECIYIPVARHFKIGLQHRRDKNEPRRFTPAGGGIVFVMAAMAFAMFGVYGHDQFFYSILGGALVLACVSFADDLYCLPPPLRLIIQFSVVSYIFGAYLVDGRFDLFLTVVVFCVGFMNAFNFMDGINGMLAAYGIVVLSSILLSLHFISYSPVAHLCQIPLGGMTELTSLLLVSLLAFSMFNFRARALVFSGDIGSITMGYFIAVIITYICIATGDFGPLAFVSIYVVDSLLTFVHRLFEGEKVMQPHRKHLYQRLVNVGGYSHIAVSATYALTQALINGVYFILPDNLTRAYTIIIYAVLAMAYFRLKNSVRSMRQAKGAVARKTNYK